MSILKVEKTDVEFVKYIARKCIFESVEFPQNEKNTLIEHVLQNIVEQINNGNNVFLKHLEAEKIAGFILVKEFWNLSDLYVLPENQGRKIGSLLLEAAIVLCKLKSPKNYIWVNSSLNAEEFYRKRKFTDRTLGNKKPYSVPLQYEFPIQN